MLAEIMLICSGNNVRRNKVSGNNISRNNVNANNVSRSHVSGNYFIEIILVEIM